MTQCLHNLSKSYKYLPHYTFPCCALYQLLQWVLLQNLKELHYLSKNNKPITPCILFLGHFCLYVVAVSGVSSKSFKAEVEHHSALISDIKGCCVTVVTLDLSHMLREIEDSFTHHPKTSLCRLGLESLTVLSFCVAFLKPDSEEIVIRLPSFIPDLRNAKLMFIACLTAFPVFKHLGLVSFHYG